LDQRPGDDLDGQTLGRRHAGPEAGDTYE
jgi:hypothetical protein